MGVSEEFQRALNSARAKHAQSSISTTGKKTGAPPPSQQSPPKAQQTPAVPAQPAVKPNTQPHGTPPSSESAPVLNPTPLARRQELTAQRDVLLRVPPQNIEAEEAVLGACLLDPLCFERISQVVGPDDFYLEVFATL
jgi:hypothetical protein